MLPPRPIRRLVLAPLVIVIAVGFVVLSPFLALLALVSGLLARSRAGHMRSLRLLGFALVWVVAETVASGDAGRPVGLTRPVIVLSRHAGPGGLVPACSPAAEHLQAAAAGGDEGDPAARP